MRFAASSASLCLLALCGAAVVSASSSSSLAVHLSWSLDRPQLLHHATATVTWQVTSGAFDPVNDYVSAWWNPFPDTYIQYHNITGNTGSASFDLINARHDFYFRYYRGDAVVAQVGPVTPVGNYPMGVRIVVVPHDPNALQFIWTSNRSRGTEGVLYGTTPGGLSNASIDGQTVTYSADEINDKLGLPPIARRTTVFANLSARALRCTYGTCYNDFTANKLFVDPGFFHVLTVTNLPAGADLWFSLGEFDGYMTEPRPFRTRVAPGANAVQILYLADAGVSHDDGEFRGSASHNDCPIGDNHIDGAEHVYDAIRRDPRLAGDHVAIMNGDISYARGWPWVWELFHNETEDIFGRMAVLSQYGNHEFDYSNSPYPYVNGEDAGGEAGIPTARRFNYASEDEPWYWVAMGPVAYFSLSSEHDVTEQAMWLTRELPKVDRTVTPWLVVALHRPVHMSSVWFTAPWLEMLQEWWTPLFQRYGVDVVLTGHEHYYERLCAISDGMCATAGVRDVWSFYRHTEVNPNGTCHTGKTVEVTSDVECRQACLNETKCTGVTLEQPYQSEHDPHVGNSAAAHGSSIKAMKHAAAVGKYTKKYKCSLLSCPQPFDVVPNKKTQVWSVQRVSGRPPVYVVDGTAGGVFTDTSTPYSPLTVYKDFERWGYSRITANRTAFVWEHYHIDGTIVDTFTLNPVNNLSTIV